MKKLIDIIDTTNEPNILQPKKHGGARTNAGAKPKYPEETTMVSFRCPKSRVPEFRAWGHKKLNEFKLVKV